MSHIPNIRITPSLNATIQETLRIHSTSSLGLPRLVSPGPGIQLANYHFPPNTALSVPAYTIHHSPSIWNPTHTPSLDPDVFNPNRWLSSTNNTTTNTNNASDSGIGSGLTDLQKSAFIPFSTGPRACVGRNVAEMELKLITSTVARGFDFQLTPFQRERGLRTREGFLRKPMECAVLMRRRRVDKKAKR